MDALSIYINCARIIARRDWERDKRIYREVLAMPPLIEIKGLGQIAASVRDEVRGIRALGAVVQENASGLRAELGDINDQITQVRSDIKFEAETLGNSPPASPPSATPETGASSSERASLHDTKEG